MWFLTEISSSYDNRILNDIFSNNLLEELNILTDLLNEILI